MSKQNRKKSLAIAMGATLATGLVAGTAAYANDNPFGMTQLSSGYMVAGKEGKCGEGKCGEGKGAKKMEGKCGEGKCGEGKGAKKMEGKCGEGKCGGKKTEGKCGEGKCGGNK